VTELPVERTDGAIEPRDRGVFKCYLLTSPVALYCQKGGSVDSFELGELALVHHRHHPLAPPAIQRLHRSRSRPLSGGEPREALLVSVDRSIQRRQKGRGRFTRG